jgi:hypothetical protein
MNVEGILKVHAQGTNEPANQRVDLYSFGETKRRNERRQSRPEWLRTTCKTFDVSGNTQALWDAVPPQRKFTKKSSAERASTWVTTRG